MAGLTVHIASHVMAIAGAGEIVVTSTVKDLAAGSDVRFVDRWRHPLTGVGGEGHLYTIV